MPFDEQITLDLNALPGERRRWPKFHTGVAVALQQCGEFTSENPFDSSKRTFSRPSRHDLDSRHAGYLLGLGLTGQIRSIAVFQVFEYLDPKHDLTSIAILLGMATAFIGSADATVSSMLAVHLQAVHPSGSAELNISLMIQSAAMLSHGLLYMGTRHRGLSDKILKELSRNVLRNKEHAEDCREAYALSSGMALGFIMLGSGKENRHLENDALLAKLKALIDSGGQHALRDPAEGQTIDVSITSPAAIAALGLVFLDSHREDVLELLALPESEDQLDYIRPDLILLKTTAQCLVQFSSIEPSKQWVLSHLPTYVKRAVNRKQVPGPTDSTDIELSFWSAVTGTCFAIGLRYAGTASVQAYKTLMEYLQLIIRPSISRRELIYRVIRFHSAVADLFFQPLLSEPSCATTP